VVVVDDVTEGACCRALILFPPANDVMEADETAVGLGVTECVGKTKPGRQGVVVVVKEMSANVLVMLSHLSAEVKWMGVHSLHWIDQCCRCQIVLATSDRTNDVVDVISPYRIVAVIVSAGVLHLDGEGKRDAQQGNQGHKLHVVLPE
jgi:hypothetical protein